MQTSHNKNYTWLSTSHLTITRVEQDQSQIPSPLSLKNLPIYTNYNSDSLNIMQPNKQYLSWSIKKKPYKKKIQHQRLPDFLIKNVIKSQSIDKKLILCKNQKNTGMEFLDSIKTVEEIDGCMFQQNNNSMQNSTQCSAQLTPINNNNNMGFLRNQHKKQEQKNICNYVINNHSTLYKKQQGMLSNCKQYNPQKIGHYQFIQNKDKKRIHSPKAKNKDNVKKNQFKKLQINDTSMQNMLNQQNKSFEQSKQVKRLMSSVQISKFHEHSLHFIKYSKSPIKLYYARNANQSPDRKRAKINLASPTSIKNKPNFLYKKSSPKVSRLLLNNQILTLNVLSNNKDASATLQILKLLADNNTTTVYLVKQIHTNFLYVLKKNQVQCDPLQFQFLIRQGKVGAKLDHPSLLKTYCTLYDKQNIYQLMQYMQGLTLYQKTHTQRCSIIKKNPYIKSKRIQSQKQKDNKNNFQTKSIQQLKLWNIKYILISILQSVAYMHKQGIIHRDIKPSNIFISHEQTLKIGDFGSVGFIGSKQFVGTLDYVTPQVLTRQKYDYGVDIWSIGCIAYELWTGLPPFYHQNREKTIDNIIKHNLNRQKITDPVLLNLIDQLLQKDPTKRIKANETLKHPFLESCRKSSNDISSS